MKTMDWVRLACYITGIFILILMGFEQRPVEQILLGAAIVAYQGAAFSSGFPRA
jgi:hypothetical protein